MPPTNINKENSMKQIQYTRPVNRRGFTITEVIVTAILLGSTMVMVVPLLRASVQQREHAQRQQIATEAANNLLEQITADDYQKINQQQAEVLLKAEEKSANIPKAIWSVTITEQKAEQAKKIFVNIRWEKKTLAPIRLTTWLYENKKRE